MGYTHYFRVDRALTAEEFALLAEDVKLIVASSGIAATGWDGSGSPEYGPERIALNGSPACESFVIDGREGFEF